VLDAVTEEIRRVAENGCDEKLFSRLKKAQTGAILRGLNSFDAICYNIAKGYFKGYDPFETQPTLETLGPDDVNGFIAENLKPENIAVNIIRRK